MFPTKDCRNFLLALPRLSVCQRTFLRNYWYDFYGTQCWEVLQKKKKTCPRISNFKIILFKTFTPAKCPRGGVIKLYVRIQYLKTCQYRKLSEVWRVFWKHKYGKLCNHCKRNKLNIFVVEKECFKHSKKHCLLTYILCPIGLHIFLNKKDF